MPQRLPDRDVLNVRLGAPLFREPRCQPVAFVFPKHLTLASPIRKHKKRSDSQKNRRDSFEQKKPPPSRDSKPMNTQNLCCNRSADDKPDWNRGHKARDGFGPVL